MSEYVGKREDDAVRRYENARDKHLRAVQRFQGRPGDERLQIAERSLRLEMRWAREEMVRKIAMWAWNEAHDEFCDFGKECEHHTNPYVRKDPGTGGVS